MHAMDDQIRICGIELWTCIGVEASERAASQCLAIDVTLHHPIASVVARDDVHDGIDYAAVTRSVQELATRERRTIERLAEDIAAIILRDYCPKNGVTITVRKKPLLPIESVELTIHRP